MKTLLPAALLCGLLLAGCGTETKTVTEMASDPVASRTTTRPSEPTPTQLGQSQAITTDDSQSNPGVTQTVTLHELKRLPSRTCDADGYNCVEAKKGAVLVGARISITPTSGRLDECAANSASLMTADGDEAEALSYNPYVPHQLQCEKRRSGQKMKGWVSFSVPKGDDRLIFAWRPNNGNNVDDIQWDVSRPR